jgi:transcriptional regulator with XRE-family HTH domain
MGSVKTSKERKDRQLSRILADQLLKCRFKHGGTQEEVANQAGISKSTLASLESGLGNPSMALILKMADFYRMKLDDLIRDPFDRKRIVRRRGYLIESRISEFVSLRQILSHGNQIRLREFVIAEGRSVRLKAGSHDWKELLICWRGILEASGFAQSIKVEPGEFLELIPQVEKKLWSLKGQASVTLIQIKDRSSGRLD